MSLTVLKFTQVFKFMNTDFIVSMLGLAIFIFGIFTVAIPQMLRSIAGGFVGKITKIRVFAGTALLIGVAFGICAHGVTFSTQLYLLSLMLIISSGYSISRTEVTARNTVLWLAQAGDSHAKLLGGSVALYGLLALLTVVG